MPDRPAGGLPPVSIEFGSVDWKEEVERYDPWSGAGHEVPARLLLCRSSSQPRADGPFRLAKCDEADDRKDGDQCGLGHAHALL